MPCAFHCPPPFLTRVPSQQRSPYSSVHMLTFLGQESKMFTTDTATFDGRTLFRSCSPRRGCSPSPVQLFPLSLTLLLLRELPEAVPFILQCCSASLAMSEINFCAAREIKRMLPRRKGEVTTSDGEHRAPRGRGHPCRAPWPSDPTGVPRAAPPHPPPLTCAGRRPRSPLC